MSALTRRQALLGGAALSALATCGGDVTTDPAPSSGNLSSSDPKPSFDYAKYFDGVSRGEALTKGEISSEQLVSDAISRAKRVNGSINAIVNDLYESSEAISKTTDGGGYSGQPSFIKDLEDWKGAPTYYGSRAFKGAENQESYGAFVRTWHDSGIIALGKTTTPEMGLISSTEPLVTGATRNPWNTDRIPGGSSGGSAALVAARVVPFAQASDGGGSIRIPAACCGIFGLKPSRGALVESDPGGGGANISVNHAVTLTVRDSINLFSIAQSDRSLLVSDAAKDPIDRRLKIAFAPDPLTSARLDAPTRAGIEGAAQLCRDLGHEVFDWSMPVDGNEFSDNFLLLWSGAATQFLQRAAAFKGIIPTPTNMTEYIEPWTMSLANNFLANRDKFPETLEYLNNFVSLYDSWFSEFDVILTPTVSTVAPEIGTQAPDGDYETIKKNVLDFACFTSPMNVSGAASMSVPLYWSDDGMPVGAMFSARLGDDTLLFRLALELEKARPWIDRKPPVSAE